MTNTNVKEIGKAPDGVAMFSWNEGSRSFEEYATSVTGSSGTTYGITLVRETTKAE